MSYMNNEEDVRRDKIIVKASIVGIAANIFLAGFKAFVGIISHSIAVTMDAVNNISDAGSSLITIIGTKLAGKQPDKKHPWGYGRIEYLSAMLIAVIILYAGVTSFSESVKSIFSAELPDYSTVSLIIVGAAVPVKIALGLYVKKTGKKVNSDSLVNSGTDALMDSVISASTLVSAFVYLLFNISIDAWVGTLISAVIIKSGIEMLKDTLSDILGQRVSPETAGNVLKCIMEFPEVSGVYDMIFHDYGPDRLNCSAHIEVPDTMNAADIDRLQRDITMKVYGEYNIIVTAVSIYAVNTKDSRTIEVRDSIYKAAGETEHIIQIHGFHLDEAEKKMIFDVIVDFDAADRFSVYEKFVKKVGEMYPGYKIYCTLDTDFSVSN